MIEIIIIISIIFCFFIYDDDNKKNINNGYFIHSSLHNRSFYIEDYNENNIRYTIIIKS